MRALFPVHGLSFAFLVDFDVDDFVPDCLVLFGLGTTSVSV
jgi:hypothetical protein